MTGGRDVSVVAGRVYLIANGGRENNLFGSGRTPDRGRRRAGVTIPVSRSVGAYAVGAPRW